MKVLVINDTDEPTGGAAVIFDLQKRLLQDSGHEVFTFCFGTTFLQDDRNLRLPVAKKWWLRKLLKLIPHPQTYRLLRSFIRRIQPNFIVIHNNALYPLSILLACRRYPTLHVVHDFYLVCPTAWAIQKRTFKICPGGVGLKCVRQCSINPLALLFFHWPLFFMRRIILRKVVRICVAPSQVLVEYLRRFGYPVRLLRNPVPQLERSALLTEHDHFTPITVEPMYGRYLLYVGLLSDNKGVDCLIEAFAKVHAMHPWLKLRIAGDGPSRAALEVLGRDFGVADAVEFLGMVPRGSLYGLYQSAFALVVPSVWQENFPTVISEAMACGCPVIGSDRGGIPELLGQNERGLLFKPGDAQDLSNKIIMLLRNPTLRHELSKKANLYVESVLSTRNYVRGLMEIVHDALLSSEDV